MPFPHLSSMKIVILVVDDRFGAREPKPRFGAAFTALLAGFDACSAPFELHVVSCTLLEETETLKLSDKIWFHGIPVPKRGYLRSLHMGCLFAVKRAIREIQPDIVHAQGTERWCAVASMWLREAKVLTIHGNLVVIDKSIRSKPRLYWKLQTLLQRISLPRFDGVFCNSDYTEFCLKPSAKKTWRVDNPIRQDFFMPRIEPVPSGRPVLVNVGIFQERKRQLELLYLAKRLHQQGVEVIFRFIGQLANDDYGRQCRILLDEGTQAGYAQYMGMRTSAELVAEMDRAHGMIHCPSEEAFGLVVAEGLSRGLKFFGSAVGGIKDITKGVPGCELLHPDDWAGVASAITSWIKNGAPRQPDAVPFMAERYAPEVIARRHLEIYRELSS
jgi:glycosyltransferase involved in cell wall biosynthesis